MNIYFINHNLILIDPQKDLKIIIFTFMTFSDEKTIK